MKAVIKTRLSVRFHREGSMLETAQRPGYLACSTEKDLCWRQHKDQVIWSVPQRRVHAKDQVTRLFPQRRVHGLFHREGLVLKAVKRPGYQAFSTEKGWCWRQHKDQVIWSVPQRSGADGSTKTGCPEMTLCSWQDVKSQLLTSASVYPCFIHAFMLTGIVMLTRADVIIVTVCRCACWNSRFCSPGLMFVVLS